MSKMTNLLVEMSRKWCSKSSTPHPIEKIASEPEKSKVEEFDGWYIFDQNNPPEVPVLAACDTYDCGWTQDSVWWSPDEKIWMTTGGVVSTQAHLPYSHWRYLPDPPKERKEY